MRTDTKQCPEPGSRQAQVGRAPHRSLPFSLALSSAGDLGTGFPSPALKVATVSLGGCHLLARQGLFLTSPPRLSGQRRRRAIVLSQGVIPSDERIN